MTDLQDQMMPSSLIYSTLEISSPSHMEASLGLALEAWKPRSVFAFKCKQNIALG